MPHIEELDEGTPVASCSSSSVSAAPSTNPSERPGLPSPSSSSSSAAAFRTKHSQRESTPRDPSDDQDDSETPRSEIDSDDDEEEEAIFYDSEELKDIVARVETVKQRGNQEFGKGQWQDALVTYRLGLSDLPIRTTCSTDELAASLKGKGKASGPESVGTDGQVEEDEDVMEQVKQLRAALNANCAACLLKMERWKEAVDACDDALEDDPGYVKALSRRAAANEAIRSWSSLESALQDYRKLADMSSVTGLQRTNVEKAIARLPPLISQKQEEEKAEALNKLKELGNMVLGKFGLSTDNFELEQQAGGGYSMNFVR